MIQNKKIIGTLLPLTALITPHTHDVFAKGREFIDWLEKTNQTAWQILPLHETQLETGSATKHVPSPYKSYGIGLDPKYLHPKQISNDEKIKIFLEKQKEWIDDYSLFCALRDHFGTDNWAEWESGLVKREKQTLEHWTKKLRDEIHVFTVQQMQLHEAYAAFHDYAKSKGVSLIGDLPYYPSFRSPVVWAHQNVFQIDSSANLPYVSGIPNTQSTYFGRQVWGHPLYNWDHNGKGVIAFWKMRLRYLATIFDHIRFDHAKAFFAYGVMSTDNPLEDHYADGPGTEVFKTLVNFGKEQGLTIFVEDSGDKTETIRSVIKEMGVPGLRIFMFAQRGKDVHPRYADIANYPENCVAYTTTHDTQTLLGYMQSLSEEEKHTLSNASEVPYDADDTVFAASIRSAIIASNAKMVIIPIQDWLLTTQRINIPGTEKEVNDENWQFVLDRPIDKLPQKIVAS